MLDLRSLRVRLVPLGSVLGLVLGSPLSAQELGVGRGIDHVAHLVRPANFDAAGDVFTEQLGFTATPPLLSPLGAKNRLIWFADQSYLEIATFTEENEFTAPFLAFLAEHEGGKFFGAEVTDFTAALDFLNGTGYPAVGPFPAPPLVLEPTGDVLGLTPLWYSVVLTAVLAPDNSLFFLDYDEAQVDQMFADFPAVAPSPHANTAKKIDTVWLVVADLDAAIDFYQGLGFAVHGRHQKIHYLGARGATVRMGNADLALIVPDGPGVTADFAADRGAGILGASIEVDHLALARHYVNAHTGLHLRTFKYKGRERFLVPAGLTHGFLVEMVED
jgi:catechol 2,3-dioxygenase-like lactoylglutathione lyase family enzyme